MRRMGVEPGVARTVHQAALADEANMPLWLQLVGTGITTAFTAHLGAVLRAAQWPAITCLNTYRDDLIQEPLTIRRGLHAGVRSARTGIDVDEDALERLRRPDISQHQLPRMIHTVNWSDGSSVAYATHDDMEADFLAGSRPAFERGVTLTTQEDDGSAAFRRQWERVRRVGFCRTIHSIRTLHNLDVVKHDEVAG